MSKNDYDIILKDDIAFIDELNSLKKTLREKLNSEIGEQYALQRVIEILHLVNNPSGTLDAIGYTEFRPIYDFRGGFEFLESPLGKRFIDVCFYFAYIWWPKHGAPH